ncbi:MAG: hypothetical protein PHN41_04575 [Bacteroidales bacterium]|jgi:hypothetical protein|nr:hypothetical protein [Bacteroidales bacterium]MDD4703546.1 hypothetical protein [Bacteroidales bacterium]MDX9799290.1 hypothetical protein [Bacteroidales bacterium]
MKKLFLYLMLVAPIFFSACEGSEEITGKFEFTIDGKAYTFPLATFVQRDGKTIVTTTDVSNTGTVVFNGIETGNYRLGLGANLPEALLNLNGIGSSTNNLFLYYKTEESDSAFFSLFGTLNVTEYSAEKVVGTFSGQGLTKATIMGGDTNAIISQVRPFSGSFTAKTVSTSK